MTVTISNIFCSFSFFSELNNQCNVSVAKKVLLDFFECKTKMYIIFDDLGPLIFVLKTTPTLKYSI